MYSSRVVYTCEAHLRPAQRTTAIVRYLRKPRRSWRGWAVFIGLIVLNETRGTYMAAQFLAAFLKAYHP